MQSKNGNSLYPPPFPGFKHYARVNDKDEITELWGNSLYPSRTPSESDRPIRDDGQTALPYLFKPGDVGSLLDQKYLTAGIIYRYRFKDGEVAEKTSEEIEAEAAALRLAALPGQIRDKRNRLLAEYDRTQLLDAPLTPEEVAEWAVYRQALRDLTNQPGFPESVEWPEKPE
jgi:hypothetical protein